MSKKNALRSLKRNRRLEVVEKTATLSVETQERKALKRRKLVARP